MEGGPAFMLTLALIAHDGRKVDLVAWASFNRQVLARCRLVATAGTARLLRDKVGLEVEALRTGPAGGDIQIGARVAEGQVNAVVFLVDPMDRHPHEPDIEALLRLCNLYNVPLATNVATADCIMVWLAHQLGRCPGSP